MHPAIKPTLMQPKVQLSINNPCHENWQNMNPSEQGRFCNACAKEVVDFTLMSDTQVLHYFLDRKKENVCGRFYADQLNRSITKPVYPARKKIWYWNYFVMLFLLMFKGNTGKGQAAIQQQPLEQVSNGNKPLEGIVGKVSMTAAQKQLSGRVTDKDGAPIAGVSIYIKGSRQGTSTDKDGAYKLNGINLRDKLVFSSVGYESVEITVNNYGKKDVVLKEIVSGFVGDVVVTVGGVGASYDYDAPPVNPNYVAVIAVKDHATSLPVKATLVIQKEAVRKATDSTNAKGIYKLRRIKADEIYTVTISAAGYKDSVLKINGWSFNDRKETKFVFLEKDTKAVAAGEQRVIRLGGVSSKLSSDPLYVVDGAVVNKSRLNDVTPDDIENISVLTGPEATTVFGSRAQAGAIVITTKKKKANNALVKKECSVILNTDKKLPAVAIANDLKIIPNPVNKGTTVSFSFAAKEVGNYMLQVSNESGAVLQMQKLAVIQNINVFQLQTNAGWSSGIYYVTITDTGNKLVHSGNFIIE